MVMVIVLMMVMMVVVMGVVQLSSVPVVSLDKRGDVEAFFED